MARPNPIEYFNYLEQVMKIKKQMAQLSQDDILEEEFEHILKEIDKVRTNFLETYPEFMKQEIT